MATGDSSGTGADPAIDPAVLTSDAPPTPGILQTREATPLQKITRALLSLLLLYLIFGVLIPSFAAALVTLVLNGLAWMAITSTLQAEMQLVLPGWVRARGIAIYVVIFMGSQTTGALLWGLVANRFGLRPAVLAAAGVVLAAAIAGLIWRLPETGHLDPQPAVYWNDPRVAFDPEPDTGPVLVAVHFTVTAERQSEFLAAMDQLRLSRLRTGATRWELYRDAEHRDRFVEIFRVASWEEHLRQHEDRLTATDQVVEEAALAFSDPPAYGDHLLPP